MADIEKYQPLNNPFLKNLWLWKCGLPEEDGVKESIDINELYLTEWSNEFETLMRNRLVLGALRYGRIHGKNKKRYDRVDSILSRIEKYRLTGNVEYLVDVANFCLLEFEEGDHRLKNFSPIDDGDHVKPLR